MCLWEFKEAAEVYGTSASTVVRRFDKLAKNLIPQEPMELPKVIAMDEYKGDTAEGKYQLIIADGVTKVPIDKKTIKEYLSKHVLR